MPEIPSEFDLPIVREIGDSLLAAAITREYAQERDRPSSSTARTVGRGGVLASVLVLVFLGTAVALAASGVISIGRPARLPGPSLRNPDGGLGVPRARTTRLLGIRTNDPAGGPPWGMRAVSTTRGEGCLQVGRVLDGRLGVIGRDGAFGNDGRFHEEAATLDFVGPSSCVALDARGRIFTSVISIDVPASAWDFGPSTRRAQPGGCDSPLSTRGVPADLLCPESDERNLYFGALGPQARSLTYTLDGQRHTLAPIGAQGAYLIVADAAGHDTHGDFTTDGQNALLSSPITEIRYTDGRVCRITQADTPRARLNGCQPVGFQPLHRPALRPPEITSTVHARIVSVGHGHHQIVITFRAGAAVTDAGSGYTLTLDPPPRPRRFGHEVTIATTQRDISRGQRVSWRLPVTRFGGYHGSVSYIQSNGPESSGPFVSPGHGMSLLVGEFQAILKDTGG